MIRATRDRLNIPALGGRTGLQHRAAADGYTVLMQPDDEVCYCYHVSLRKLMNFARRERPSHDAMMAECLGAGTGCGWCVPFLSQIAEAAREGTSDRLDSSLDAVNAATYASLRDRYLAKRRERNRNARNGESPSGRETDSVAKDDVHIRGSAFDNRDNESA